MRKYFLPCLAVVLCFISACTVSKKNEIVNDSNENDSKILVAYFSATGTTEKVAKLIAEETGAELVAIVPQQPYTDQDLDWRNKESRSSVEMGDLKSRPSISNDTVNVKNYDIIFLGYPIWWNLAPTIVNTFIEKNNFNGKTVIPFATSGGSTIETSVEMLKQSYPDIKWQKGQLLNDASKKDVSNWIKLLNNH